ncbi:MAG: S8 family serine peptidase [Bacteroidota bacterium]
MPVPSLRGLAAALLVAWAAAPAAQVLPGPAVADLPPEAQAELDALPLDASLYQAARAARLAAAEDEALARETAGATAPEIVAALGLTLDAAVRAPLDPAALVVNVEIVRADGDLREGAAPIPEAVVRRFGGRVDAVWRSQTSAWVPVDALVPLAEALPAGFFIAAASVPEVDDEGPGVTGSDSYDVTGGSGDGITIAVIDGGYINLATAQGSSDAPTLTRQIDYIGGGLQSGTRHGTGVIETAFDHAPDADYFAYRVGNTTHLGNAVQDAIDNDADLISMSMSWYNTGWADNSGAAAAAANNAAANGLLFFTSAGNRARQHWRGAFEDDDNDNRHEWTGSDERNATSVFGGSVTAPQRRSCYLQWDLSGGNANYDLRFEDNVGNVLASSTNSGNTYEATTIANTNTAAFGFNVVVIHRSGQEADFQVFCGSGGGDFQVFTSAGSTTSPTNSTAASVLSVAAVDQGDFGAPAGTANAMTYSSRGPTNSGNRGVDLSGPTNTTTVAYGGAFGGTSCATPNAAGLAAALWSTLDDYDAAGILHLLLVQARVFRDWGDTGSDPTYGFGGVSLAAYHPNTIWIDRSAANTTNAVTGPLYSLNVAYSRAVSGGRLLFLGDAYPTSGLTMTKALRLETIDGAATLGAN